MAASTNSAERLHHTRDRWGERQWVLDQAFQRHILQAQYVDAMVGRLLRRLRTAGLYDSAVIVVTADHGASFRRGEPRRALTAGNLADIAPVPFIVKYPRQREGKLDDRAVRTIDVLPTIAKAAGVHVPWQTDGMPADARPSSAASPCRRHSRGRTRPDAIARARPRHTSETRRSRDATPQPRLVRHRSATRAGRPPRQRCATGDGRRERYGRASPGLQEHRDRRGGCTGRCRGRSARSCREHGHRGRSERAH